MNTSVRPVVVKPIVVKPIVVKVGGSTLGESDTSFKDIVALQREGRAPVLVHGGGPVISQWMQKQGLLPRFVRGLRVTDAPSLEIVVAVLTGLINKQLVATISALGGKVIGLSGVDGAILQARIADPDLGFVGEIVSVDAGPVLDIVNAGYIPLMAPVGLNIGNTGQDGGKLLNINGDTVAGHLAWALDADKLVFLTDVDGVLDSSRRLISRMTVREARGLIASGTADGGMIPKLEACIKALEKVTVARIVNGRSAHALLNALDGDDGTWLTKSG